MKIQMVDVKRQYLKYKDEIEPAVLNVLESGQFSDPNEAQRSEKSQAISIQRV